jgi:hypothetical protein
MARVMLTHVRTMKRAAFTLALVAATGGTASAGAFVGLGVGPSPAISDTHEVEANPTGRSLRLMGGYRFGNISIDAAIAGVGTMTDHGEDKLYTGWVAGRLNLPLGSGFEAFGRVGIHRIWMDIRQPAFEIAGNGLLAGAGFEYNLNLVATRVSLFVDYTLQRGSTARTDGQSPTSTDVTLRTWTLGVQVGF